MSQQVPQANRLGDVDGLILAGQLARARLTLQPLERAAWDSGLQLRCIADRYISSHGLADAARCYARAVELLPDDALLWHSHAASLLSFGDTAGSEAAIDRAIALDPMLANSWYFRSTLRRQSASDNHVPELRAMLMRMPKRGQAALHYALAKELEDLGDYPAAFMHMSQGAAIRRHGMSYEVRADVEIMAAIRATFDTVWRRNCAPGNARPDAIFVMGLPRSGTTLVESILAAHPEAEGKGEITDFAATLMELAGAVRTRAELIAAVSQLDMGTLGARFLARVDAQGRAAPHFVDKTPINFLYVGLIDAALSNSSIIHVCRHPLDTCLALYKTWFNMAAPYSYHLGDMAQYYMAYAALMDHWRALQPTRFLDLRYEDVVADQAGTTARLLAHCALPWNDRCLEFHRNKGGIATASAAQVRSPVYRSSVGSWKHYERELEPLADALSRAGIDLG